MPPIKVQRNISINAPKEKVAKVLSDFHTWQKWSPWLIMDPNAKVDVEPDGKAYTWEGSRVGSGAMKVEKEDGSDAVYCDLQFIKPFKSKAKTFFELKQNGNVTDVTWFMDSSLPFFMFFMKKSMEAYIGNDYERGLNLLKDYVEDGEAHSKLNWIGESSIEGGKYIGITRVCTTNDLSSLMPKDFEKIGALAHKIGANMDKVFSQYHKFDMVSGKAKYTVGLPVDEYPEDLNASMIKGEMPAVKTYVLEHRGPYRHIGNAWATMSSMARSKEFKAKKSIHPFETYGNSPANTPENDLITHLHFAVK